MTTHITLCLFNYGKIGHFCLQSTICGRWAFSMACNIGQTFDAIGRTIALDSPSLGSWSWTTISFFWSWIPYPNLLQATFTWIATMFVPIRDSTVYHGLGWGLNIVFNLVNHIDWSFSKSLNWLGVRLLNMSSVKKWCIGLCFSIITSIAVTCWILRDVQWKYQYCHNVDRLSLEGDLWDVEIIC